jgi:GDP-fucose transporter C1
MVPTIMSNHVKVAAVVLFYMSSALVMVFVNKAVLNSSPELPLLFLLLQLFLAVVLLHIAAFVSERVEIPKLEVDSAKKLTPVIFVNVVGLVFNTLCLRDVEASFFQIARGLVLPLTIIVSSFSTHTTPSSRTIFAALIVTTGFVLGVAPSASIPVDVAPSILSLFYGVLSSLFIALHAVLIKMSLPHCNNSTIQLAYWTNLGSVGFLAPFILFNGELGKLRVLMDTPTWNGHIFLWGSLVTGVFGFLLCVAGLLSIKVTSPITHMFSSAARSVLQTILGVWLFSDILTTNRASSIFVILLGTMYYTWVKSQESAPPPKPSTQDVEAQEIAKNASGDSDSDTVVWEVPEKDSKN